eukprot:gb/GECG01016316.1/.p1 GENE.gb/GECG01016316.1/~~gb/GECG01016316.1/.p1  ORF type:complete len:359 (+),score=39.69 gb/GECG01016316.1/:1-1077(+)
MLQSTCSGVRGLGRKILRTHKTSCTAHLRGITTLSLGLTSSSYRIGHDIPPISSAGTLTKQQFSTEARMTEPLQGALGEVIASLETYAVTWADNHVLQVEINRPKKLNAMNKKFWQETRELFNAIGSDYDNDIRCVILKGAGKSFTAGLDLEDHVDVFTSTQGENQDTARSALRIRDFTRNYQAAFTAVNECSKPVIAAVHGACIGGGVDLICSADIRYCTTDAYFCIKEAAIGMAADVGTLQRLPRIVGNDSLARELAFTARNMAADEAHKFGLVSHVAPDESALAKQALETAQQISGLSPLAVQGTKYHLNYARDNTVQESLDHQAVWNGAMLQTSDIMKAAEASMTKQTPQFPKL